jgi:hypothetical protein
MPAGATACFEVAQELITKGRAMEKRMTGINFIVWGPILPSVPRFARLFISMCIV